MARCKFTNMDLSVQKCSLSLFIYSPTWWIYKGTYIETSAGKANYVLRKIYMTFSTWFISPGFYTVRKHIFFPYFPAVSKHICAFPQRVSPRFAPIYLKLGLLCEMLGKTAAKPGWLPRRWETLDFPSPIHTVVFPASVVITSPSCTGGPGNPASLSLQLSSLKVSSPFCCRDNTFFPFKKLGVCWAW